MGMASLAMTWSMSSQTLRFSRQGLVAQEVGRVVGGHERDAAKGLPVAAQAGDALGGLAQQALQGGGPEGDDDLAGR